MELAWRLRLWMRSLAYYMRGTQTETVVRRMRPSHRSERLAAEGETSGEGRTVWAFTGARKEAIMV